jgi:pimeloyl-ACP methyl ester carboxylesterase
MHVREWGGREGRPLVFWHALGAGTSGAYLTEVAPTLTEAGLRLIAPDAPGFGQSPPLPPERYRIELLVDVLRGVLDERGIERAILMGHSWGGTVVMSFAAASPERVEGLVLVDTGHMDYQDSPNFPHGKSLDELIDDARAPDRTIRTTEERFREDAQKEARRPVTEDLVRGAVMAGLLDTRVSTTWPAIGAADIPVLLLLATEPEELRERSEAAVPVFLERLPAAEVHWIENAGHDLFADAAPELARLLRDWATRLPA